MSLRELHLSKPGIAFPRSRVSNDDVIARVREHYRGPEQGWQTIQSAIEHIFGLCRTQTRFLDFSKTPQEGGRVADNAVQAAERCLEANNVSLDEVDLVINGSIARQYFEPATAMEVAAKLGLKKTHALDVTAACVGHLEAIQAAAGYLHVHDHYRTALVCTSELFGDFLSYDIQSVKDLYDKSAGLTVGNAAACLLLRKHPWPGGGIRLLGMNTHSAPGHWHLCQAPIDGTFTSSSVELMRLGKLIPPWVRQNLDAVGWAAADVDHYLFHQPSEIMVRKILEDIGAKPGAGVYTHSLYGNTASASVAVTYQHMLETRQPQPRDKIVLGSAAAGFTVVVITGEWTKGEDAP